MAEQGSLRDVMRMVGMAIENGDETQLGRLMSVLSPSLQKVDRFKFNQVVAGMLRRCVRFDQQGSFVTIVEHVEAQHNQIVDQKLYTEAFLDRQFDVETVRYMVALYEDLTYADVVDEVIELPDDGERTSEILEACRKLGVVFGPQTTATYEMLLGLAKARNNQTVVEYLTDKMADALPYAPKPAWVFDFQLVKGENGEELGRLPYESELAAFEILPQIYIGKTRIGLKDDARLELSDDVLQVVPGQTVSLPDSDRIVGAGTDSADESDGSDENGSDDGSEEGRSDDGSEESEEESDDGSEEGRSDAGSEESEEGRSDDGSEESEGETDEEKRSTKPTFEVEMPPFDTIVDLVVEATLTQFDIEGEDETIEHPDALDRTEQLREAIGAALKLASNQTKAEIVAPFVAKEIVDQLQMDDHLIMVYGPDNPYLDADVGEVVAGQWRMFNSTAHDYDEDTFEDRPWFSGECDQCRKKIRYYWYAVRIPEFQGGWRDCLCSFECLYDRLDVLEQAEGTIDRGRRALVEYLLQMFNSEQYGIQDRQPDPPSDVRV